MTAMNVRDGLTWRDFPLAVGAAAGTLNLRIGGVGQGKPVVTVTAGVHGDEGPWSARAIHQMLERTPMSDLIGTLRVVPVSNPLAMEADARCAPLDVLDLNRVFPGNPNRESRHGHQRSREEPRRQDDERRIRRAQSG
ncbi:MAG: hypothetical protein E6I28_00685 [Chloroflexi bacterium]|nr:MAG: hypothetical protein E6I28_00685 [Chloroflexota bacterium]